MTRPIRISLCILFVLATACDDSGEPFASGASDRQPAEDARLDADLETDPSNPLDSLDDPRVDTEVTESSARFEEAPCPDELAGTDASCGRLIVPESRVAPTDREVALFVTRYPSRGESPAEHPVLLLQGGPGLTPDLASFIDHPLRDYGDLIVLDQRGVGRSTPSLACAEVADDLLAALMRDVSDPDSDALTLAAAQSCRDRLVGEGIDLNAYNTAESARDVADLRETLGIESWNLAGNSNGTRLALTVLRDYPEGIRSLALSGPKPPQVDSIAALPVNTYAAFDRFFAACEADEACAALEIRERSFRLFDELEAIPLLAELDAGDVLLDGDRLLDALRDGLYDTPLLPILPHLIVQIDEGDLQSTAGSIRAGVLTSEEYAFGLRLSVECAEEVPFTDTAALAISHAEHPELMELGILLGGIDRELCEIWDVETADPSIHDVVVSDVPVLIMAGEFDPVTPSIWGELAVETLSNGFFLELPGVGHDATATSCGRHLRNVFFGDPTRAPHDPCLDELGSPF